MIRPRHTKPVIAALAGAAVLVPAQIALASHEHHDGAKPNTQKQHRQRPAAPSHPFTQPKPQPKAQALTLSVSGPGEPAAATATAGDPGDTISDYKFSPASLTVHVGDTVSWTNAGPSAHTATARDGSFNTGLLQKGQSGSFTFSHAGTYSYYCTVHPFMHGTIVVLAAATTPSSTTPSATTPSSTTPTATTPTTTTPTQSGSTLPVTGIDLAGLGIAGLGLLGLGLGLRRRSRA